MLAADLLPSSDGTERLDALPGQSPSMPSAPLQLLGGDSTGVPGN
jgi:hypothetical protein